MNGIKFAHVYMPNYCKADFFFFVSYLVHGFANLNSPPARKRRLLHWQGFLTQLGIKILLFDGLPVYAGVIKRVMTRNRKARTSSNLVVSHSCLVSILTAILACARLFGSLNSTGAGSVVTMWMVSSISPAARIWFRTLRVASNELT